MNSKGRGEVTEGIVLAHLLKLGKRVCLPFGDNLRYDLVLDEDGVFVRAQVKTGRLVAGSVMFNTASVNGFTGKRTSYHGQADVFLVYCPQLDTVYRIPIELSGTSNMSLRVDPLTSSAKAWKVQYWAKDFEI